jgi:hypothetical protein
MTHAIYCSLNMDYCRKSKCQMWRNEKEGGGSNHVSQSFNLFITPRRKTQKCLLLRPGFCWTDPDFNSLDGLWMRGVRITRNVLKAHLMVTAFLSAEWVCFGQWTTQGSTGNRLLCGHQDFKRNCLFHEPKVRNRALS